MAREIRRVIPKRIWTNKQLRAARRSARNAALDEAVQVVNDARVEGYSDLREIRERIRGLKARDESEDQQHG